MASLTSMKLTKRKRERLASAASRSESLTTAEAATITGYTQDHIGLLIRKKTLRANKRGRDWFLDARDLLDYVSSSPRPGRRSAV
jgi:excisionase family DNA binding protein